MDDQCRHFSHSPDVWAHHPDLVAGVISGQGISADRAVEAQLGRFTDAAAARLAAGPESEFVEVQAWRRAFARMGLKPTQYRCASESLLRRYRRDATLPRVHPLVDLCNAVSMAFGIPVAALDLTKITGNLEVRPATGAERYLTFTGEVEHPVPGEVVFADDAGQAHARRWTNRQSGHSAVRDGTATVLIVAEAMHDSAPTDVPKLVATVEDLLREVWSITPSSAVLSPRSPRFRLPG